MTTTDTGQEPRPLPADTPDAMLATRFHGCERIVDEIAAGLIDGSLSGYDAAQRIEALPYSQPYLAAAIALRVTILTSDDDPVRDFVASLQWRSDPPNKNDALALEIAQYAPEPPATWSECVRLAKRIRRLARAIHRLAETACNRELTDDEKKRDENAVHNFKQAAKSIGCGSRFSGDPRGCCAFLVFPEITRRFNTWGGVEDGWGVE